MLVEDRMELEINGMNFIDQLTNNKGQKIRQEMYKFLRDNYWHDDPEAQTIKDFIDDFFITEHTQEVKEFMDNKDKKLTSLERGIFVKINKEELKLLEQRGGLLEPCNYPDNFKEIQVKGEIGRFLIFRLLEDID